MVVSCGAINSAALLLKSSNDQHPNGLANASDVVGRHYMAHINSGVIAISQTPNLTKFQKTLGINDYYWGADDAGLPLGHIQMLAKSDKDILRAGAPWFAPGLALDYIARHAIDFWITTEDLPHPANRVTVDRRGRIPLAKTTTTSSPQAPAGQAQAADGAARLPRAASQPGRSSTSGSRSPASPTSAAPCASVRTRKLGPGRQLQGPRLDNLYVVDTSFFPSSSAVNPALTAMANALRVGDHLLERLDATTGPRSTGRQLERQWRFTHEDAEKVASSIGKGTRRRVCRHRGDDGLEHSRGAARNASQAPGRRARPPRRWESPSSRTTSPSARFNDLSHWGYGTGWGVVRGLLDAAGLPSHKPRRSPTAPLYGGAPRSRCPRST